MPTLDAKADNHHIIRVLGHALVTFAFKFVQQSFFMYCLFRVARIPLYV